MTESSDQKQVLETAFSEDHKRLRPFVGTFKAKVHLWMGPGEPFVSTGTMVNAETLGGRYLEQTYRGDPVNGHPGFEGRGYWGFNTTTRQYEGFWIDNASTGMAMEYGQVDASGTEWTMTGEVVNPRNGKPLKQRSVIRLQSRDHHSMESFHTPESGEETKSMAIEYIRVE